MEKENVLPTHSLGNEIHAFAKPCTLITKIEKNFTKKTQSILNVNYYEFMKAHTTKDKNYTHTSFIGGKWMINDDELDLFYNLYSKEIKMNKEMCITEKHREDYGPIIIDFDFKYENKIESPLTKKVIDNIVNNLTNIIKDSFSLNENYMCIVSKRKDIYLDSKSQKYKDGIHIIFPYIVTSYDYQFVLRERYMEIMDNDVKNIPFYIEKSMKDNYLDIIYDKSVIEDNNWFLYMSSKPNINPYIIYKIYNNKLTLKDINKMELVDLVRLMSIRNKLNLSLK